MIQVISLRFLFMCLFVYYSIYDRFIASQIFMRAHTSRIPHLRRKAIAIHFLSFGQAGSRLVTLLLDFPLLVQIMISLPCRHPSYDPIYFDCFIAQVCLQEVVAFCVPSLMAFLTFLFPHSYISLFSGLALGISFWSAGRYTQHICFRSESHPTLTISTLYRKHLVHWATRLITQEMKWNYSWHISYHFTTEI